MNSHLVEALRNQESIKIEQPNVNTLAEFTDWFLSAPMLAWTPAESRDFGPLIASVIYKNPPWQVELVVLKANAGGKIPVHRHPNMDSIEVLLSGCVWLIKAKTAQRCKELLDRSKPIQFPSWKRLRIGPMDWHSAIFGDQGGMFLSVQKWLNNSPSAAGLDWEGDAMHV